MGWESQLMSFARSVDESVHVACRRAVKAHIDATAGQGLDPSGEAWDSLSEGGKALSSVSEAVKYESAKGYVKAHIYPPYVYHNHGAGGHSTTDKAKRARAARIRKQKDTGTASKFSAPRRQILPDSTDPLPKSLVARIEAELKRSLNAAK